MSEKLKYIRLYEHKEDELKTLVIQLAGGGASINFKNNEDSRHVIIALEMLAKTLREGIKERSRQNIMKRKKRE